MQGSKQAESRPQSQGDAGRHGGHQQDGRQVPERHHVQVQEESGVDCIKQAEEAGDILKQLDKKRAKKQRQKNRRCPLQQVEGVGQGLDQEQVLPATIRLVTKCYVEGCSYDTIQQF